MIFFVDIRQCCVGEPGEKTYCKAMGVPFKESKDCVETSHNWGHLQG